MHSKRITWLIIGVICGILFANHPIGQHFLHKEIVPSGSSEQTEAVSSMNQIYNILQKEYYDKDTLSLTGLWEGSIKGFVSAVKDPYTEYFTIDQNKEFSSQLQGQEEFEGIGAAVQKKDDYVQIQEVYKGTPSAIAGLRPMDGILEINGEKTKDLTVSEAVQKIRGPKGTQVKLLIYRATETEPAKRVFTVEVTRQNVTIPSVNVDVIQSDNGKKIAYIEIALIGEQTEAFLKKEIDALSGENIAGVILDLRGNGGGYLPKAVEIASHFIPAGKVVVTGKYSIYPTEEFTSKGYGDFENVPVVVLVDGLTASAGEIIAGAIKQHRQALLIGTKTFGKGSIQTVADIGSGAGLKYTIGKRYLPDGSNVHPNASTTGSTTTGQLIGIPVDIDILFDREQYEKNAVDVQKNRAIEELKKLIK